jgi:hypothetical protein
VQYYLAAHKGFVEWLDDLQSDPDAQELERRLRSLAMVAAARGMTSTHWTFVIDGLIAHANRSRPGDVLLSSCIARGFDYSQVWDELRVAMASDHTG